MRKIIVAEFLSLDGVMEEPQNWSFPHWNDEIEKFKHDELFASDAQLLGRVTCEGFAAAWPSMTGDYADRLNEQPAKICCFNYPGKGRMAEFTYSQKEYCGRNR